jgi:probable rRNA maturation factor
MAAGPIVALTECRSAGMRDNGRNAHDDGLRTGPAAAVHPRLQGAPDPFPLAVGGIARASTLGRVSIEVSNESGVPVDAELIVSVARHALQAMRVSPAAELSIIAVTTDAMAELHERWMDEPGPTDVMSFPMDELVEESRRPDASTMGPALLGDIVLCPEFAKAQARSAGHSLDDELHLLTVHGVLHLLGYDHAEPDEEREMFALQATLLADWRRSRSAAAARAAQRRSDSAVLGTVGLDDT